MCEAGAAASISRWFFKDAWLATELARDRSFLPDVKGVDVAGRPKSGLLMVYVPHCAASTDLRLEPGDGG